MKKKKVTFNELIAGALLKFGKVDSVDITLLMNGISSVADVVNNDRDCMENYFIVSDGSVLLNDSYIKRMYKGINNVSLERMQGSVVKECLDNLDIEIFTLRKVGLLKNGLAPRDDVIHVFSVLQLYALKKLYQEGYVMDYWQDDSIYDDYLAITLTKRGMLQLFLLDNKKAIDRFASMLSNKSYNALLIQAFLITQNLDKHPVDILTLDNFMKFCNEFDLCPYASGEEQVEHHRRKKTPTIK